MIYPVDSVIHLFNNWGLIYKYQFQTDYQFEGEYDLLLAHVYCLIEEMIACEQALCLGKGWNNCEERGKK